jgi:choline monooxygenase
MLAADPELARSLAAGYTLPAEWYTDPAVLQRERERIFGRSWLYAGPASLVSRSGSYVACEVGGYLPAVIVRDGEGRLQAFVNVCRHRGHLVARGSGACESLQCPYHAWTYGLDGRLRAAPRSALEPGFDKDDFSLLPMQAETFGPLLFVNPDPAAGPLAETLRELPAILARSGTDLAALRHHHRTDLGMAANWKIAVENYLECYHCPVAHKRFSAMVDVGPDAYRLESRETFLSQFAPVRDAPGEFQYHLLWPNLAVMLYAGPPNLIVYGYEPDGPEGSRRIADYFSAEEADDATRRETIAFSTELFEEDRALVESVQRGLRTGRVRQGRVLPRSELLVHRFQSMVYQALSTEEERRR